jgi:hypothetical protein
MADPSALTLDYCLGPHELYISLTDELKISEMHFRTPHPLTPVDLMEFLLCTFKEHEGVALAAVKRHLGVEE